MPGPPTSGPATAGRRPSTAGPASRRPSQADAADRGDPAEPVAGRGRARRTHPLQLDRLAGRQGHGDRLGRGVLPEGAAAGGGWPLIAWAHGTTGVADVCAPSFMPRSDRDQQYLSAWLAAGYAIVATDYAGLGTPGPHPYLQPRSEGLAVLDSARRR
ncbi:hypothetical protein ACRAWD_18365 [Caulobacter segnis]